MRPTKPSMNTLVTPANSRRRFLTQLGLAASLFTVPGAFAEELTRTPAQTLALRAQHR